MNKKLKTISKVLMFLFLILNSLFLINACSCSSSAQQEANIPSEVLEKGNRFIISKTGEEFFKKYIQPDFSKSKEIKEGYFLLYNFYMPEKPFVNGMIRLTVDSTGTVLTDREISGIPNCIQTPTDCVFIIDENQAVEIAKQNKLEEGIKEWHKGFVWDVNYNKYIWRILSTLHEMIGDFGYRGNGTQIIIDPNSGDVLAIDDWRIN
ncbi:MAG: hypothetical protein MUO34_14745 [Ignavibacteriaceae bacterium]|nr:hypothetical protein [Ignavibacteriaceae bacterium]